MKRIVIGTLVCAALAIGIASFTSTAWAGKKPGGGGGPSGCPKDIQCLDVWDPVTCADGITYSNQCYANRACAPGPCTPGGSQI